VYTDKATHDWVQAGCRSAGIGCIDCKKPIIDAISAELEPMQQRAAEYEANPDAVREALDHYEELGVEECLLNSATADLAEIDGLLEVLQKRG
jgi:tryptophanyl-tRNA synthetase